MSPREKKEAHRLSAAPRIWDSGIQGFRRGCGRANDTVSLGYHVPLIFQGRWRSSRSWSFQVWLALQGEFQQHREQYRYCSGKETARRICAPATFLDALSFGQSTGESHLHWVSVSHHILFMGKENALLQNGALERYAPEGIRKVLISGKNNTLQFELPPFVSFPLFSHSKSATFSWRSCQTTPTSWTFTKMKKYPKNPKAASFWIPVQVWCRWAEISFPLGFS